MKKNVLFVSPTFYQLPLTENIIKKHQYLDEVVNVTVLAFSNQKIAFQESKTNFYLSKKVNSRILNYLKILLISYFQIPKLIKKHNVEIVTFQDPITSFIGVYKIKKNFRNIKMNKIDNMYTQSRSTHIASLVMILIGIISLTTAFITDSHSAWTNLLFNNYFFLGISIFVVGKYII